MKKLKIKKGMEAAVPSFQHELEVIGYFDVTVSYDPNPDRNIDCKTAAKQEKKRYYILKEGFAVSQEILNNFFIEIA